MTLAEDSSAHVDVKPGTVVANGNNDNKETFVWLRARDVLILAASNPLGNACWKLMNSFVATS
jgi:hypothetical protein